MPVSVYTAPDLTAGTPESTQQQMPSSTNKTGRSQSSLGSDLSNKLDSVRELKSRYEGDPTEKNWENYASSRRALRAMIDNVIVPKDSAQGQILDLFQVRYEIDAGEIHDAYAHERRSENLKNWNAINSTLTNRAQEYRNFHFEEPIRKERLIHAVLYAFPERYTVVSGTYKELLKQMNLEIGESVQGGDDK